MLLAIERLGETASLICGKLVEREFNHSCLRAKRSWSLNEPLELYQIVISLMHVLVETYRSKKKLAIRKTRQPPAGFYSCIGVTVYKSKIHRSAKLIHPPEE
jgi:hypothetical protein